MPRQSGSRLFPPGQQYRLRAVTAIHGTRHSDAVWEPQGPDVGFYSRRVLNISSIGARITPPGSGCYSATKAAEAIATVAESAEPPSLLVLGKDAFDAFDWVAQAERADLDRWRDLSLSTGIEG